MSTNFMCIIKKSEIYYNVEIYVQEAIVQPLVISQRDHCHYKIFINHGFMYRL